MSSNYFMELFYLVIYQLPWLVIAAVAGLAFFRGGKSIPVVVQAISACGVATILVFRALLWVLVRWLDSGWSVMRYVGPVLGFVAFVLLCVFAGAYAVEKLRKKKEGSGFPVA